MSGEQPAVDKCTAFWDRKNRRAREMLVFMAETQLWQEAMQRCHREAGVDAKEACTQLADIYHERVKYYNSKYNIVFRPKHTPGIPPEFERIIPDESDSV